MVAVRLLPYQLAVSHHSNHATGKYRIIDRLLHNLINLHQRIGNHTCRLEGIQPESRPGVVDAPPDLIQFRNFNWQIARNVRAAENGRERVPDPEAMGITGEVDSIQPCTM